MFLRTLLLLMLMGAGPLAAQTRKPDISFDKRVNFASYKTYMWGVGTLAPNPTTHQKIVSGVDERLAAAGWRQVSSDADVLVLYHVSINPETKINSYSSGGPYDGYQWGVYDNWDGSYIAGGTVGQGTPVDEIQTIEVGELVVDMAEVKTKNFMWRGAAKEVLKDRDPKKIQKKVKSAIANLFKNFPPGSNNK